MDASINLLHLICIFFISSSHALLYPNTHFTFRLMNACILYYIHPRRDLQTNTIIRTLLLNKMIINHTSINIFYFLQIIQFWMLSISTFHLSIIRILYFWLINNKLVNKHIYDIFHTTIRDNNIIIRTYWLRILSSLNYYQVLKNLGKSYKSFNNESLNLYYIYNNMMYNYCTRINAYKR